MTNLNFGILGDNMINY